jgi:hypothetical protein
MHRPVPASTMALIAKLPRVPSHDIPERNRHPKQFDDLSRRVRSLKAGLYQSHVPRIPPPNDAVARQVLAFMHKRGPVSSSGKSYDFLRSSWTHVPKPREAFSDHRHHPDYQFMKKTGQKYSTLHRALQLHSELPRPIDRRARYRHDMIGKQLFDAVKQHDYHHFAARERWTDHQRYFSLPGNRSYHQYG